MAKQCCGAELLFVDTIEWFPEGVYVHSHFPPPPFFIHATSWSFMPWGYNCFSSAFPFMKSLTSPLLSPTPSALPSIFLFQLPLPQPLHQQKHDCDSFIRLLFLCWTDSFFSFHLPHPHPPHSPTITVLDDDGD